MDKNKIQFLVENIFLYGIVLVLLAVEYLTILPDFKVKGYTLFLLIALILIVLVTIKKQKGKWYKKERKEYNNKSLIILVMAIVFSLYLYNLKGNNPIIFIALYLMISIGKLSYDYGKEFKE